MKIHFSDLLSSLMAFFSTSQFSDDDDEGDARPRVYYEDDANEHVEGEEPDYSTSQGDDP